jgi:hypothetical protein
MLQLVLIVISVLYDQPKPVTYSNNVAVQDCSYCVCYYIRPDYDRKTSIFVSCGVFFIIIYTPCHVRSDEKGIKGALLKTQQDTE